MRPNIFSLRLTLLVLTWCFSAMCSEVLVMPPLSAKVAMGATASFTCSTVTATPGALAVDWYIQLADGYGYYWTLHFSALGALGFSLGDTGAGTSILRVLAKAETNGTSVQCIVSQSQGDVIRSNWSSLFVFDRPSPPTNLSLTAVGEGALLLAWVPAFVPAGVTTWYRVIVRDDVAQEVVLNSSVATGNASYEYRRTDPTCRIYKFSVIASNAAGNGDASRNLATTIPTVPRFSSEAVHQVTFNTTSIHFSIKPPIVCPDFPVKGYLLKIRNTIDSGAVNLGPYVPNSNSSTFHIDVPLSSGLQKGSMYNSTIEAFNVVGGCTTSLVLYTTDVQSSTITGSDHQLNVTCFFAEGTLAKGCVVYLEKSGNVLQQKLPRTNMAAYSMIKTELSVDCYNISVVDWEEDGSIGPLNIPTTINIKSQTDCNIAILQHTPGLANISIQSNICILYAAFVMIVGLLVVIAILLAILIHYKRKSMKRVSNERNEGLHIRLRSQMSTSSDTHLLPTQCTLPSTPLSSSEQTCSPPSTEEKSPFPAPHSVLMDSFQSSANSVH